MLGFSFALNAKTHICTYIKTVVDIAKIVDIVSGQMNPNNGYKPHVLNMKKEIEERIEDLEKIEADQKKTFEERVDATMEKMRLLKKLKEEEEN